MKWWLLPILAAFGFVLWSAPNYRSADYNLATTSTFLASSKPPEGWSPSTVGSLDDRLPMPWPAKYKGKQDFNPWVFFKNARLLCDHYKATKHPGTLHIMKELKERFVEFTELIDGARFVIYKFPHSYRKQRVPPPWTSAYGSGAALIGLSTMAECAELPGAIELAHEIFAGLDRPIELDGERPPFWTSFVDSERFLWFEEMPLPGANQPRILNGHIRAVMGLHAYWVVTRSANAERLLEAGILTIEKNAPRYRRKGEINRYDLLEPPVADYGPERTVTQQDYLFKITGDSDFAAYRDSFRADIDAHKTAAN